jgi:ribonuclease T2
MHGGKTPYFGCSSGALSSAYYYFYISGNAINGTYSPVDSRMSFLAFLLSRSDESLANFTLAVANSSNCPKTGIKYPPKSG